MEGFQRGYDVENHLHPSSEVRRAALWLDITLGIFQSFFLY